MATELGSLTGYVGKCRTKLALLVVLVGPPTAVMAVRRPGSGVGAIEFLGDLGQLVVFAILVGRALLLRRDPATHKRLMLLGTAVLMLPALARLNLSPALFLGLYLLVPLSLVAWDLVSTRRVHRATALGLGLIMPLLATMFVVSPTAAWSRFMGFVTTA